MYNFTNKQIITTIVGIVLAIVFLVCFFTVKSVGQIYYNVWQQEQVGKANLARASQERQILVQQALAEKDAAKHRAEAIETIGAAAQKYPEYRQQEFIGAFAEAIQKENISQIIYVPTEAGIPVTESHRLAK